MTLCSTYSLKIRRSSASHPPAHPPACGAHTPAQCGMPAAGRDRSTVDGGWYPTLANNTFAQTPCARARVFVRVCTCMRACVCLCVCVSLVSLAGRSVARRPSAAHVVRLAHRCERQRPREAHGVWGAPPEAGEVRHGGHGARRRDAASNQRRRRLFGNMRHFEGCIHQGRTPCKRWACVMSEWRISPGVLVIMYSTP